MRMVKVIDTNEATIRLFEAGSTRSLMESGLESIYTGGAQAVFIDKLLAISNNVPGFEGEYVLKTLSGREIHCLISIAIPEPGNYSSVLISHHDISERIETEQRILESEIRFRGTFENASVGIAHVSLEGRWLLMNKRLCEIVGYTQEELEGMTFQDISHPDDLEVDLDLARQLERGEIPTYSIEKRYLRKNGSYVWCSLTVSVVRSNSGNAEYFISVIVDITERKQAEEKSKLNEERFRTAFNNS